jgi:single-strand DNA-binding protein
MSDGLNRVTILGNLGGDPELKVTQNGNAVLNFVVAVNESYLDKNNTRQEKVEWIRCALWGKRGEALAKILTKGMKVYCEGSFSTQSYEKNGEKRYATQVNVREVILCGSASGNANTAPGTGSRDGGQQRTFAGGGSGGGASRPKPAPADGGFGTDKGYDDFAGDSGGDDEIPF